MSSNYIPSISDSVIIIFAFCFNGLRKSSVTSHKATEVDISASNMTCRLSVVKGRSASRVPLVRFTVLQEQSSWFGKPSPLDPWKKWVTVRPNHAWFFLPFRRTSLLENWYFITCAAKHCLSFQHSCSNGWNVYVTLLAHRFPHWTSASGNYAGGETRTFWLGTSQYRNDYGVLRQNNSLIRTVELGIRSRFICWDAVPTHRPHFHPHCVRCRCAPTMFKVIALCIQYSYADENTYTK